MSKQTLFFLFLFLSNLFAADGERQHPIYVYLYARIDDQINTDLTADRLNRTLKLAENFRKKFPSAGLSVVVQFSGATAQALADQNAKTGLVNLVKRAQRADEIEIGYHGANEPAKPPKYPDDFMHMDALDRWDFRLDDFVRRLYDYHDPITGESDSKRPGGLREVRQVFGPLAALSGLSTSQGGDPEIVHLLRRDHDDKVIIFGFTDPNPDRHMEGYTPAAANFGTMIAPEPDMAPEMYWLDGILRSSEFSGRPVVSLDATQGPAAMQKLLSAVSRSHPHVLHVELSSERLYLTDAYAKGANYPPVRYGYGHPAAPKLPAEALRPKAEVEAAYERQEELLQFLASEFFPANAGSRFVSSAQLMKMTPPGSDVDIKLDTLKAASAELLKAWGETTYPPSFVNAGGRYFSLTDLFQLMTSALAEQRNTGKLPETVHLNQVYGPILLTGYYGDNMGRITRAALGRVCAQMAPGFNHPKWSREPENAVPTFVLGGDLPMNSASFLRIMAQAMTQPEAEAFDIHVANMPNIIGMNYPNSRPNVEQGSIWTIKPAPLHAPE